MTRRDNRNKPVVLKFFLLVVVSFLLSKSVFAQMADSLKKSGQQRTKFFGYSLSGSSRQYQIKSNIKAIDRLTVPSYGVSLGVVMANEKGSFRGLAGMYYGSESLPYSIDGLELGVSKTVYLLRLKQIKYHTFEPYIIADFTGQRASFFGSYLDSSPVGRNQSTCEEPLLGRVSFIRTSIGLGVEYQLESTDTFLNFFAEVKYGAAFGYHASEQEFIHTTIKNSISIDLGVNFGKLIFR